jgi:hypothetical protein
LPLAAAGWAVLGGTFLAWIAGGSRPLAETLTGLLAGLGAGVILSVVLALFPQPVGTFRHGRRCRGAGGLAVPAQRALDRAHLPRLAAGQAIAAPLVAALVAAVVGASMWMVAGTTTAMLDLETKGAVDRVLAEVPAGFIGGMLGGAVTGVVLELLGFRLEDHQAV